jgi:hypothetical protein
MKRAEYVVEPDPGGTFRRAPEVWRVGGGKRCILAYP